MSGTEAVLTDYLIEKAEVKRRLRRSEEGGRSEERAATPSVGATRLPLHEEEWGGREQAQYWFRSDR